MSFWRRIGPGVALAGVALGLVAGFDRALRSGSAAAQPTDSASTTPGQTGDSAFGQTCDTSSPSTGDTVQTRWGPVQVVATVTAGGQVCEAQAVVHPSGDAHSVQINDYALPIIDSEVTDQGVAFDAVTGATVTSDGYRQSLQSILDSL